MVNENDMKNKAEVTEIKVNGEWMIVIEWTGDQIIAARYSNNGFFKETFEIAESEVEDMI